MTAHHIEAGPRCRRQADRVAPSRARRLRSSARNDSARNDRCVCAAQDDAGMAAGAHAQAPRRPSGSDRTCRCWPTLLLCTWGGSARENDIEANTHANTGSIDKDQCQPPDERGRPSQSFGETGVSNAGRRRGQPSHGREMPAEAAKKSRDKTAEIGAKSKKWFEICHRSVGRTSVGLDTPRGTGHCHQTDLCNLTDRLLWLAP
jgi:hypothetical protein